MDNDEIKAIIREAIQMFIDRDKEDLLRANVYEPTISHRIAVYLEKLFLDHNLDNNIDCEYNKSLLGDKRGANDKKIRPDIVVHKRINNDNNLVVFEIKKSGKDSKLAKIDIGKLKNEVEGDRGYKLGVFIGVLKRRVDVCWVENINGQILESPEILR